MPNPQVFIKKNKILLKQPKIGITVFVIKLSSQNGCFQGLIKNNTISDNFTKYAFNIIHLKQPSY